MDSKMRDSSPLTPSGPLTPVSQGTPSSVRKPAPLTFGVEMEFILFTLFPGQADPHPGVGGDVDFNPAPKEQRYSKESWMTVHRRMASALQEVSVPAFSYLEEKNASPEAWVLKNDISIRAATSYSAFGIEITTPVLKFTDENLDQVKQVCKTITTNFRVQANFTCGLHVHIGDGTKGFDHHTLRNLAAFLWCFEAQLNQIHPKFRTVSHWANEHAGRMEGTQLGRMMLDDPNGKRTGLEKLLECKGGNEVVHLMRHTHCDRAAYHFGLQERGLWYGLPDQTKVPQKPTIEFRAHVGTLDGERVVHWVKVCEGLLRYARDTSTDDVASFCHTNIDLPIDGEGDQACTLLAVLSEIGCAEQGKFYTERILRREVELPQEMIDKELADIFDKNDIGAVQSLSNPVLPSPPPSSPLQPPPS